MSRPLDKRMSPAEIVGQLSDGMTLGIGGWGPRRKPMALVREILRSDLKDLTVVAYGGADVGMLCAAGKVRKLVFAFVSLDAIPLEPWFRKAREAGAIDVLELDEGMLQWGLKAAAFGLPFLPTRVGLGTDLAELGGLKTVQSPYADEETLIAMPALALDAALIHVNRADRRGNIQALGPDTYYDEWFARAAARTFVSCEELVEAMEDAYPQDAQANIVERSYISGVAEIRGGAHPSSLPPAYGWDMKAFKAYADAAKDPGDWSAVADRFVGASEDEYIAGFGGTDAVTKLPLPVF
ncbi:acyl CoA--acetate/3-ketoacid CoA transferase subunit alpha [Altererythrobacter aerius]|uniref:Acyl CoA--acetate/3-ketoacid CoA transferase subunit alpha n=1 Tax=Tsuneonella aeria TaxID=1837929 RepID=A0A6I4TCJ1_9SPHN|nr:CoA transferase subunit A [Tsuneonella aeria]MXO74367.1 acyl CoA--acetate/3-ketoacid CoA transferase subunit alpha [Tsuneonella aeria]